MEDTSRELYSKQREIFLSHSLQKRFMMGIDMMEAGWKLAESSFKNEDPEISAIDLKIKVFKRMYSQDFSEAEINKIIAFFNSKKTV